jgi:hypothetical protein
MDARVGLPFASMQAMSAAGILRAVEVLRREINVASLTDKSESMKNIRVVIVDVGLFDVGQPSANLPPEHIYKAMEDWSPSEKVTYGPAFASILHGIPPPTSRFGAFSTLFQSGYRYGVARRATNVRVFVDNVVGVVTEDNRGATLFALGLGKIRNWIRGERFSVGAGGKYNGTDVTVRIAHLDLISSANTYRVASHLPSLILDSLLNIPHILISIRNRILPVEPFRWDPNLPSRRTSTASGNEGHEPHDNENERSETSTEADAESNASENSWISLQGALGESHD